MTRSAPTMGVMILQVINVPTRYEAYLQTEAFNQIRQAVFARDGYKCVVCGSTQNIQPHHLTYHNIYHENVEDLITLCRTCHATYHAVEKRAEAIEAAYEYSIEEERKQRKDALEAEIEERKKQYEAERLAAQKAQKEIVEIIKSKYLEKDYCKNGDMDLIDWSVFNTIVDTEEIEYQKTHGGERVYIFKPEVRNWFLCRRYELLLRCLDKGFNYQYVRDHTKFDSTWLFKWYRRDKLEAKLKEEQEIQKMKGEQT